MEKLETNMLKRAISIVMILGIPGARHRLCNYKEDKMLRKKILGFVIAVVFLLTNCVYAVETERRNIFQKRAVNGAQAEVKSELKAQQPAVKAAVEPVAKSAPAKKEEKPKEPPKPKVTRTDLLYPSQLVIPSEFGSVKEYWPHDNSAHDKIIIHIQDAHCNYEAQMNLAKMLEYLYQAYGVTLILVEGGSRSDSLSYMREYAPKDKRIEVADKYLKNGKICGENYLDIVEEYPVDVFGIEKPELYDANMSSFMKLDEIRDRDLVMLDNLRQTADALKEKIYSPQLMGLEAKKKDYTDEKMKFKDYAVYLLSFFDAREKAGLKKQGLKNMMMYDEALALEQKTDLKATELERGKLLEYLTRSLPQARLKKCLAKTQDAKDNKIKQSEYYNYLKGQLPQGKSVEKIYPNLFAYIDYLNVFDKIDNEELFKELPVLEDAVYKKLIGRNKEASELYFISKGIETFEGLIEIKITPDETKFYTDNKNRFKIIQWKEFLSSQAKRFGIATNIDTQSTVLDNHFAFIDSFYGVAKQRENAFLANSVKTMDTRLPVSPLTGEAGAFKPKNPNAPKPAVLICGGYHTNTLLELFRKAGIAYVVVAPNVTTATDKKLYRSVLKEVYTPMARPENVDVDDTKPTLPGLEEEKE